MTGKARFHQLTSDEIEQAIKNRAIRQQRARRNDRREAARERGPQVRTERLFEEHVLGYLAKGASKQLINEIVGRLTEGRLMSPAQAKAFVDAAMPYMTVAQMQAATKLPAAAHMRGVLQGPIHSPYEVELSPHVKAHEEMQRKQAHDPVARAEAKKRKPRSGYIPMSEEVKEQRAEQRGEQRRLLRGPKIPKVAKERAPTQKERGYAARALDIFMSPFTRTKTTPNLPELKEPAPIPLEAKEEKEIFSDPSFKIQEGGKDDIFDLKKGPYSEGTPDDEDAFRDLLKDMKIVLSKDDDSLSLNALAQGLKGLTMEIIDTYHNEINTNWTPFDWSDDRSSLLLTARTVTNLVSMGIYEGQGIRHKLQASEDVLTGLGISEIDFMPRKYLFRNRKQIGRELYNRVKRKQMTVSEARDWFNIRQAKSKSYPWIRTMLKSN